MITRYSPVERFRSIDRFAKLMEDMWGASTEKTGGWFPPVDIVETDKNLKFVIDLPGMTEKDIEVELLDNMLSIKGKREEHRDEKTEEYTLCERNFGAFERRFTVDASAQAEKIKANFEKGVLTVNVPKAQSAKPKKIEVSAR